MKTYTTKIAKNGATLYYSVETGKRIAKETALENERNYIIANATAETAVKAEFEAIEKATELASNFSHEVQELFTAKADVDTLRTAQAAYEQAKSEIGNEITTCHRALDDMTKDTTDYYTEREILINGLLKAEDKALAAKKAIYKQALLTALIEKFSKNEADETIKEETKMTNETKIANELPKGEITTDSVKAAELIAAYFPNDLHFCGASKGYNKEDVFTFTDDKEKFYAIMYSTPDNSRIELIEVIKSYESGSKRRPFTVIIDNTTAEEDDNDDELVDEPNGYLYEINGHPVSNAEYVKFCESIIADLTPKRAYYWQAMQEATNDDDHDTWLHEYCDADETIQECIADIAKITGKEIVDDKSYPGDETPEPAAAEPVDEFTAELERLKAEQDAAKEKELEAKAAYDAAAEAYEERRVITQKFLDEHALKLCNEIQAITTDKHIKLINGTGGSSCTVRDFTNIYVDTFNEFGETFIIRYWNGRRLGRYDTPAQVEQVIAMIKAAIERGDTEFTFPTIEQLNTPTNSTDAEISDSLTRAMQTAEYNVQTYRRHNNPDGMRYEMELYSICADALNELKRRVA